MSGPADNQTPVPGGIVTRVEALGYRSLRYVAHELGWRNRQPGLQEQLANEGLWALDAAKPSDPKRTIEWALREARRPRSSSIYRDIATTVGLKDCVDPSFLRFQSTLRGWFPTH